MSDLIPTQIDKPDTHKLSFIDEVIKAAKTVIENSRNPDCGFVENDEGIGRLDEALKAYARQPGEGGWIVWDGDACPVPFEMIVDISKPDGIQTGVCAGHYIWRHFDNDQDITAYRLNSVKMKAIS